MPLSSRKTEILEQISATHLLLEAHMSALSDAQMLEPGVNGQWTVKDVLAHITWWEQHLLLRLKTGQDEVFREEISMQGATDRANASIYAANRLRPLADILDEFHASYQQVLTAVEALSEEDVAQAEICDAIAWDTFRHYPEHTAMLQTWMARNAEADGSE
jgi:uncharacterized damage-inducible protein DinB